MKHDLNHPRRATRCRFCGGVLARARFRARGDVCELAACRAQLTREQADQTARRHWVETLRKSREQIGEAAGEVIAGAGALNRPVDQTMPVAIPLLERRMVPVAQSDRRRMADHLDRIVARAFQAGAPGDVAPGRADLEAPTSQYVSAACATCKGACCEAGRDHMAFLSAETIAQYRRHTPDLSADQVRDHYVGRLPGEMVEGSCLFHGVAGCTLDREQRDDICNRHLCQQIHGQRDAGVTELDGPFVMVAADEHGNRAVTLFDPAGGVRPLSGGPHPHPGKARADRIVEHAFSHFPPVPPLLRANAPARKPLCTWCNRPITPSQAALGASCGRPRCERARRERPDR